MGGTVDPKTGQVQWEFHVPLDEQPLYYAAHPPTALKGLKVVAVPKVDFTFDGHGEPVNAIFAVRCPCGGELFTPCGHWDDDAGWLAPIAIECEKCDESFNVFDETQHGWDAAMGNNAKIELPPAEAFGAIDLADVDTPCRILVRFEYPSDVLGDPGVTQEPSELFSWITILGQDPEDGSLEMVFENECA